VDRIVDGDLLAGRHRVSRGRSRTSRFRKTRERNEKLGTAEENGPVFAAARAAARKKFRNMIAPLAAIDAVEAATTKPFAEGLEHEALLFKECLFSDQSKAMIHVFFGEREVAKIPDIGKDTPVLPVKRVAIVGAGTMGGGIAMTFANAGIPVLLKEADQAAIDRGLGTIQKNYANSVKRGRFTEQPRKSDWR
jgi:3-hydroxyacyl-CoA dehydrogenase